MTVLEVRGLSKSFGGIRAVNEQIRPDAGSVRLAGREVVGLAPRVIWRLGVGRTFQIAQTFDSQSVAENVQQALLSHHRRILDLWHRAREMYREDALGLLAQVGMREQAERHCAVLAYGDLKRVELAIALAHGPRLLLMDEPTAGMAPEERVELMTLIGALARERNVAVLFTEHDMDVEFAHADRILVLNRGALIAEGTPAQVEADPLVREVYLGAGRAAVHETASGN